MKEVEAFQVEEEVLNVSEQFCWDIESEITHGFRYMRESFANNSQRFNANGKLNSIHSYRNELINQLESNIYDSRFPNELINTQLKKYLKIYFESFSMSNALLIQYSNSLEYGKHIYNNRTRTLIVCPLSHYPIGTEDFSFSSLDKFKPLINYLVSSKVIIYLNELEDEIYNKQIADQHIQEMFWHNEHEEIKTSKTFPAKTINKSNSKILAFNYNGIKDDKLSLVLIALIKLKAIPPNTTLPQLRALFNGRKITNPIEWLAAQGDLATFVKELIRIMEPEFTSYNQHWNIVGKCFVKKGGIKFDPQKLRNSKPTLLEQKYKEAARKLK